MRKQLSILVLLATALGLALMACGGGGDDNPTKVVEDLFKAIGDKDFAKIPDFACDAQKDEARESYDFVALVTEALGGADVDPQMVLDMLTLKVSNLGVEERSRSGDRATIHVKVHIEMAVDPEKFNALVQEVLKEQGFGEVSDDMIQQSAGPILDSLDDLDVDLDDDLTVVKEDGKWLICSE